MFWKSDFWTQKRELLGMLGTDVTTEKPMWKDEPLMTQEDWCRVEKHNAELETKINLILKEIGKEYKPKKDTTEPAKLVDSISNLICVGDYVTGMAGGTWTPDDEKPKKKRRGRPKGSKTKKK